MFARHLNHHQSFQFGRDSVNTLGKVGTSPIFKPIGVPNPTEARKEAVSSIQRLKR